MSVALTAERRRQPLSSEHLARIRDAVDPRATGVTARALMGGIDVATYALRLERDDNARELVVRVYRDWEGDASWSRSRRSRHSRRGRSSPMPRES